MSAGDGVGQVLAIGHLPGRCVTGAATPLQTAAKLEWYAQKDARAFLANRTSRPRSNAMSGKAEIGGNYPSPFLRNNTLLNSSSVK